MRNSRPLPSSLLPPAYKYIYGNKITVRDSVETEISLPMTHYCRSVYVQIISRYSYYVRVHSQILISILFPQGLSKKDKLHRRLAELYNKSMDNVDVFTVFSKLTVKDAFLDVRFSAHGSPYFEAEKLDSMVIGIQEKVRQFFG